MHQIHQGQVGDADTTLIDLLQNILVIASFFGALYAPFHYLDRFASSEARAKARIAIKTGQFGLDSKPLATMLDAIFGARHFSFRCFALSAVMSIVFTFLLLGIVNVYVFNLPDYFDRQQEQKRELEQALDQALAATRHLSDTLIEALEDAKTLEGQRKLEELKEQRAELERMMKTPLPTLQGILLWMLASVALSLNVLCDYAALGKTRLILLKISKSESQLAVGAYLVLDLLLAAIIWTISMTIFILLNIDSVQNWLEREPTLVILVGVVSLATTVATSIWIYTFLLGGLVSNSIRNFLHLFLRSTAGVIDPYEHPFKIIGIVGASTIVVLLAIAWLVFKFVA